MTREQLEHIFDNTEGDWQFDNAFKGLRLIAKYLNPEDNNILTGAEHNIIYSIGVDDILNAGLNEQDARTLALLNWIIDGDTDSLACFV